MAVIGTSADVVTVRAALADHFSETASKVFTLDGGISDATLVQVIEDMEALTNAAFSSMNVSAARSVSSLRSTPVNALERNISVFITLTFTRANPLNAAKTIVKAFTIPAPVASAINSDGSLNVGSVVSTPATAQEHLARLIDRLEDNLVYEDASGAITAGGWTFVPSRSGAATTANVIDGA